MHVLLCYLAANQRVYTALYRIGTKNEKIGSYEEVEKDPYFKHTKITDDTSLIVADLINLELKNIFNVKVNRYYLYVRNLLQLGLPEVQEQKTKEWTNQIKNKQRKRKPRQLYTIVNSRDLKTKM